MNNLPSGVSYLKLASVSSMFVSNLRSKGLFGVGEVTQGDLVAMFHENLSFH